MEVASQHCDTVPNKTKDILDTVNWKYFFIHDSRPQHPMQSSAVHIYIQVRTVEMKVSHTETFKCQFSITITGVGDLLFTNTNGYVCHLIHSGHSHYHRWWWWSSIHQHQRFCTRPLEELSNEYTNLNSSEQPNLHQLSLQVTSEEFLNYQCSSDLSSIKPCKSCYILNWTQLWSKLNHQGKPCSILSSTQQHSSCILIRSDPSSMQLNTAQCNSAR